MNGRIRLIILGSYHTRFLYCSDSYFKLLSLSKKGLRQCEIRTMYKSLSLGIKNQHAIKSCRVFRICTPPSSSGFCSPVPQLNTSLFPPHSSYWLPLQALPCGRKLCVQVKCSAEDSRLYIVDLAAVSYV